LTGQPYSDKSKVVAGLLQLIPGFFFGFGGIGRVYSGYNKTLGFIQMAASVFGWICFWCGFLTLVTFGIYAAIVIWFIVDGILILAGNPTDEHGRPLKS